MSWWPAGSIGVTLPSSTWTLRWLRSTTRVGGAISPSEMIPVATWYSNGWNGGGGVGSINLMATLASLTFFAALSPPNPDPMMTTRCRRSVPAVASGWGLMFSLLLTGLHVARSQLATTVTISYYGNDPAASKHRS